MRTQINDERSRLLAAVGWSSSPFWKWWAKGEIMIGLAAVATGVLGGMHTASAEARPDWFQFGDWVGWGALIVLGGYLALAGHRSHLYQSNNLLAAYLAAVIRDPGNRHEHSG